MRAVKYRIIPSELNLGYRFHQTNPTLDFLWMHRKKKQFQTTAKCLLYILTERILKFCRVTRSHRNYVNKLCYLKKKTYVQNSSTADMDRFVIPTVKLNSVATQQLSVFQVLSKIIGVRNICYFHSLLETRYMDIMSQAFCPKHFCP